MVLMSVAPACSTIGAVLKGFTHARLACDCRLSFRDGVEGSPVTVLLEQKSPACTLSIHVTGLPLYDYREALRPPTRARPPREEEFEEES